MSKPAALSQPPENVRAPGESRSEQISSLVKRLINELPPDEQERLLNEITEKLRPIPAPRAGDVLSAIVRLLPRRRDWTMEELKQGVSQRGIEASPKEVHNAVGYLVRKGRMRRVGYGRYVLDGVELVTSEDLGGESSRHEDGYRI